MLERFNSYTRFMDIPTIFGVATSATSAASIAGLPSTVLDPVLSFFLRERKILNHGAI